MPQSSNSLPNPGFVNPAELWSDFPVIYDVQSYEQQLLGYSMGSNIPTDCDPKSTPNWKSELFDLSTAPIWHGENNLSTLNAHDDRSGSSASNSPSPRSSSTQPNQSQKRRAQNRAAQRAYRDRKMRYLVDLRTGIQDVEDKIGLLQSENTELIRQLCEMRAANHDLRDARRKDFSTWSESDLIAAIAADQVRRDGPAEAWSKANSKGTSSEELYEPFAAMWNLMHLDPSVVRGTVTPHMVLERLQAMVEFSSANSKEQGRSTAVKARRVPG